MVKVCAAVKCPEKDGKLSREKGISFHKFPQDKSQRKRWFVRVRRMDPKTKKLWQSSCSYLCSNHFEPECFFSGEKKKRLKRGAEPTLFPFNETNTAPATRGTLTSIVADAPPPRAPPTLQQLNMNIKQEHGYTKEVDLVREINNLKRKLKATKQELSATKKRLKRREKSITSLSEELVELKLISEDQKRLLTETYSKLQLDTCGPSDQRREKCSDDVCEFATTLYIYSPMAYEFVRKHYRLPHPRTLRRWFSGIDGKPGFSQQVFDTLASKVQEPEVTPIQVHIL